MATYVKFQSFVEALAEGAHDLGGDQLQVALTNTAPSASTDTVLGDIVEIAYTNLSAQTITTSTSAQTAGTYKLVVDDLVLTASGAVGPFQYVVVFNQDAATDELICYFDYGSSISLANGETFTCDFDGTNGLLQIV